MRRGQSRGSARGETRACGLREERGWRGWRSGWGAGVRRRGSGGGLGRISLRKGWVQREEKVSLEKGSVRKEWVSRSLCGGTPEGSIEIY